MEVWLLIGAALVVVSILLIPLVTRVGAPLLLLFLGIGMLAGEDGPGRILFSDFELAYDLGSVALAVILFSGGLATRPDALRVAWKPAAVLASLGVVLTSALVGGAVASLLGVPWKTAFLLGAVVGSTDAAATFLLLRGGGIQLRGRVQETLELESGLNDPMAIFLTTVFVGLVDGDASLDASLLLLLAQQLALGAAAGLLGGWLLAEAIRRIPLEPSLKAGLALAGALALFAGTQLIGGSGFLAAYLCGLLVSRGIEQTPELVHFHDGLGWLCQIGMFLMLGTLVTPSRLPDEFLDASVVAAAMIFLARPVAVMLCCWPFGFSLREQVFLSWVGLRGAVPIFLAIIPVATPGPVTDRFFNTIFVVVIASLLLQGSTMLRLARALGLAESEDVPTG